jgi:hypothetical protein
MKWNLVGAQLFSHKFSIAFMPLEDLDDEIRIKIDPDGLKEELADEFLNGDADEALQRMEDVGIDVDGLDL